MWYQEAPLRAGSGEGSERAGSGEGSKRAGSGEDAPVRLGGRVQKAPGTCSFVNRP